MNRLILLFAFLALAGCAKGAPPPVTPEAAAVTRPALPAFEPMAFLPANTFAVARVDVPRVLASPYFAWVESALGSLEPDESAKVMQAIDVLRTVSSVHISLGPDERRPQPGVVLFQTSLDAGTLQAQFVDLSEEDDIVPLNLGGRTAFGDDQGAFVELEDGWWLVGPRENVEAALVSPSLPAALSDADWNRASQRAALPAPMVEVVLLGRNEGMRQALRGSPLAPPEIEQVRAGALQIDATDGVQVRGVLLTDVPALAQRVVADVQAQLQEAESEAPPFLPVQSLLQTVTVVAEGGDVLLDVNVPDATVRSFYAVVTGFLGLMQSGGSAGSPPPPVTP
ncbi:MAG: hypothetical protein AAF447_02540 [Myxococcota bacterium]